MDRSDIIIISPVGQIPSWISQIIAERMADIFGFETRIEPLLTDIGFAYDRDRNQYYSTLILEKLEQRSPESCLKLLAVTEADLFIPILTHVYGEAQLGGKASIISIARLMTSRDSDPLAKGRNRLVKEAAHELGHTFDLRHCEDKNCIMYYCRRIEDVDEKSDRFCRYCRIFLSDYVKTLGE